MAIDGPAVVVGGASGIGAAVAELFRDEGTDVVVWDVSEPCDILCDVADSGQIATATVATIDRLASRFGYCSACAADAASLLVRKRFQDLVT